MKRFALGLLFIGVVFCPNFAAQALAGDVGVRTIRIEAPHREYTIQTLIWYPAAAGGVAENVGDNPLFVGVPAMRDAPMTKGQFPLIIVSHGSGGNAANLGWLATVLAAEGFVVAAPNHPGTTSGDSIQTETVKVWNRPADLSAVLTQVLADDEIGKRIDGKHVSLAGFSLGGYTVLASAGARVDAETYARYCDTNKEPVSECSWLARGGADLHRLDKKLFNQSNIDERFSSVVSIDPGLAQAFTNESLAAISIPTLVINLGQPGKILLAVDAAQVVKRIPGADYRTIADAVHFSFLGICKPNAKQVLIDEGETDPLCDDGGGRPRSEIHADMASMVVGFFKDKLTN